jgi:hypothetical protein
MTRNIHHYYVVPELDHWAIVSAERRFGPYANRSEAQAAAMDMASDDYRDGHDAAVNVQDRQGRWAVEQSYAHRN